MAVRKPTKHGFGSKGIHKLTPVRRPGMRHMRSRRTGHKGGR
jgi:hypothetical protein